MVYRKRDGQAELQFTPCERRLLPYDKARQMPIKKIGRLAAAPAGA